MPDVSRLELQSVILKLLADPNVDRRLGRGVHYFPEAVMNQLGGAIHERPGGPPVGRRVSGSEVAEVLWSFLGQGLVYIDMTQNAPENWTWVLTGAGWMAAVDQQANPDDPDGYLARLRERVPEVSATVLLYAEEAVRAYTARCYLACATMLGVASEAAFLEVAHAFVGWLPAGVSRSKFQDIVENSRLFYVAKFEEFRKRIETHKDELPSDLRDGMALTTDAVLDLLRVYRNDAGHPTGKRLSREDQFNHLQMFVRYLEKLYALSRFFRDGKRD